MAGSVLEQPRFQLNAPTKYSFPRKIFPIVKAPLEKVFLLQRINKLYREIEKSSDVGRFLKKIIEVLNIKYRLDEKDYERIPQKDSVVVIMNHPFGGIEGIILAYLLKSRRRDIKITANFLLAALPELTDLFIFVDPFERKEALYRNLSAFREAMRWVEKGGLLGIFPAGEVSHLQLNQMKIIDPSWSESIVQIIKKTKSPVLPVWIKGGNGPLFQIADLVHPRLRTALLPRELPLILKGGFYKKLAAYGHMGRMDIGLPWELTDKAQTIKAAVGF